MRIKNLEICWKRNYKAHNRTANETCIRRRAMLTNYVFTHKSVRTHFQFIFPFEYKANTYSNRIPHISLDEKFYIHARFVWSPMNLANTRSIVSYLCLNLNAAEQDGVDYSDSATTHEILADDCWVTFLCAYCICEKQEINLKS